MKERSLSRFTPSVLDQVTLEAVFVQRHRLAEKIVDLIRASALGVSKHYILVVGPRGIGKTHLVSLVYHRIKGSSAVRDRLAIAWLREEEWGIASFLDFLVRVIRSLVEEYECAELQHSYDRLFALSAEEAELEAELVLRTFLRGRTLLLIAENLDEVFRGLENAGQHKLRAYIQNNPFFTILATSQSLFNGVALRTSPFYGFFEAQHLHEFSLEDAIELLSKIAAYEGDMDLAADLRTAHGRARVRAVHHLASGNPRVYVIFSQFLTRASLDSLVEPLMQTLDDLTPYYHSRMSYISPQQRKIVEFLCERRHAVSVGEIAQHNFISSQTASSQLQKLRELGYVRSQQLGRDSYYELREPLMRLSLEVKKMRGEPIRLFVEFLRMWYSPAELYQRLAALSPDAESTRKYLLRALQSEDHDGDARHEACVREFTRRFADEQYSDALQIADDLIELRALPFDWARRAVCLFKLGRIDEARKSQERALEMRPTTAEGWADRGRMLILLDRDKEALEAFDEALGLSPWSAKLWFERTTPLEQLGRFEEALQSYKESLALNPASASAWEHQSHVLAELGRQDEAVISAKRATELAPESARAWLAYGMQLLRVEKYPDALSAVDQSLSRDGQNARAWERRARILEKVRELVSARDSIDRAIELRPKDASFKARLATILAEMGHLAAALEASEDALRLDAGNEEALFCRWAVLDRMDRVGDALKATEELVDKHPSNAKYWGVRAYMWSRVGRFREHLEALRIATDLDPEEKELWESRAVGAYETGELQEALEVMRRCVQLDEQDQGAWANLAIALSALGFNEDALQAMERSFAIDAEYLRFHRHSNYGAMLMEAGRWDEGLAEINAAIVDLKVEEGTDSAAEVAIVRNLLIRTQDVVKWEGLVKVWISVFREHGALGVLGQGIVASIRTIMIEWLSEECVMEWAHLWNKLGGNERELQIPLKLLRAAAEYRASRDRRALLTVALEERSILTPLLGIGDFVGETSP